MIQAFFDLALQMLGAEADTEGRAFQRKAAVHQHLKGIPRGMSHREHHGLAGKRSCRGADAGQAAILLPKFRAFAGHELDDVNRAAAWYTELLGDKVITPYVPEGFVSSWAQYSILLKSPEERAAVQKALKEQDVPSMLYYPRGIHQQGAYRDMGLSDGDYPNTIEATRRVLALPMHPYLTEEDVRFITGIIRRCV